MYSVEFDGEISLFSSLELAKEFANNHRDIEEIEVNGDIGFIIELTKTIHFCRKDFKIIGQSSKVQCLKKNSLLKGFDKDSIYITCNYLILEQLIVEAMKFDQKLKDASI